MASKELSRGSDPCAVWLWFVDGRDGINSSAICLFIIFVNWLSSLLAMNSFHLFLVGIIFYDKSSRRGYGTRHRPTIFAMNMHA